MRSLRTALVILIVGVTPLLAQYVVVLKDGRRYEARQKWTVVGGKAIIELTNGSRIQIDPSLIDARQSEAATKSGLGDAKVLAVGAPNQAPAKKDDTPSLGSLATIRKTAPAPAPGTGTQQPAVATPPAGRLDSSLARKFTAAFENVGLYDARLSPSGNDGIRIDVTADNEDQVFKAISATSFIYANVPSSLAKVELYMQTNNGGSAGRFVMSKADAAALANKQIQWYDYYVRNVIF